MKLMMICITKITQKYF